GESRREHLFSANIGLPSPLIHRCSQWPAYTTLTSPMVKMLVEQDEVRKAGSQGTSEECRQGMGSSRSSEGNTPGRKPSDGSQEAGFTGTTQESSRPNEDSRPLRIARVLVKGHSKASMATEFFSDRKCGLTVRVLDCLGLVLCFAVDSVIFAGHLNYLCLSFPVYKMGITIFNCLTGKLWN
uniref:Uncharacterized protein n=1 Tax=Chelonoidis abingdonii TaxID=106734 RepID=A0A8C0IM41_CHEAB